MMKLDFGRKELESNNIKTYLIYFCFVKHFVFCFLGIGKKMALVKYQRSFSIFKYKARVIGPI